MNSRVILRVDFACGLAANQDARARKNCATAAILDSGWTLAPYFRAAWLHEWDTARSVTANLPVAPDAIFTVAGTPAARNAARLTGSVKLAQATNIAFYANVVADVSAHGQAVGGNLGFTLSW